MTTLVAVYGEKRCVGTCDANCYEAKGSKCTCICAGANHGKGFEVASGNVWRDRVGLTSEALERFARVNSIDGPLVVVDRLIVPSRHSAKTQAKQALWMKRYQMELPFETTGAADDAV